MKKLKISQNLTNFKKNNKNIGKFFILFVFFSFFLSIILLSNIFARFLNVKNLGFFASNVNASSISVYCVAFGNYETEQSAFIQAEYLKEKGGAGFIYKIDNSYTVLLSGYLDKAKCNEVLKKNVDNFDKLHMVEIVTPKTNYSYNGATTNIEPLKEIINLKLDTFNSLHDISNKYDSGEFLSSKTYNELFTLAYNINNKIESFKKASMLTNSISYKSLIMDAENIYSKVNSLILSTEKNKLSQSIKYCSLDIILLNASWLFYLL